jgi:hypothetical protein
MLGEGVPTSHGLGPGVLYFIIYSNMARKSTVLPINPHPLCILSSSKQIVAAAKK